MISRGLFTNHGEMRMEISEPTRGEGATPSHKLNKSLQGERGEEYNNRLYKKFPKNKKKGFPHGKCIRNIQVSQPYELRQLIRPGIRDTADKTRHTGHS